MKKWCARCKRNRKTKKFYRTSTYCKTCTSEYNKEWARKNPDKAAAKDRRAKLKRAYGITVEQYDAMLEAQDGKCAICRKAPEELLCVDHDHLSGKIRGLLCRSCNTGLGCFQDNIALMKRAGRYLALTELENMGLRLGLHAEALEREIASEAPFIRQDDGPVPVIEASVLGELVPALEPESLPA